MTRDAFPRTLKLPDNKGLMHLWGLITTPQASQYCLDLIAYMIGDATLHTQH